MKETEVYTSEQMNNVKKLIQIIATIPDDQKIITVVAVNAYLDGFMAGNSLEREAKSNSE